MVFCTKLIKREGCKSHSEEPEGCRRRGWAGQEECTAAAQEGRTAAAQEGRTAAAADPE